MEKRKKGKKTEKRTKNNIFSRADDEKWKSFHKKKSKMKYINICMWNMCVMCFNFKKDLCLSGSVLLSPFIILYNNKYAFSIR